MSVKIQPFEIVITELKTCLQGIPTASIEHIGSTSVPHLAATPLIDIAIILSHENLLSTHRALIDKGRFEYLGEVGNTASHAFKDKHEPTRCTVSICVTGTTLAPSHIHLRDLLRSIPLLRGEFAQLKLSAVARDVSIAEYTALKHDFIQLTLRQPGSFCSTEIDAVIEAYTPSTIPLLRTERLVLREYVMEDVEGMFELESGEENVRYQDHLLKTREHAREHLKGCMGAAYEVPRREFELAVECEGRFIGRVGGKITRSIEDAVLLGPVPELFQTMLHVDLWYSFLPSYQGRGLATEAVSAFIAELRRKYVRSKMELEIECDPRNTGSWKLAERLGFSKHSLKERDYECKGEWVDSLTYRKTI